MKILVEPKVVLDVLLNRQPFVEKSSLVLDAVERSQVSGFLCATTVTTLDYLLNSVLSRKKAKVSAVDPTQFLAILENR